MVSQERLHQLEQHEKDIEDGITASDSEEEDESPSPEKGTPEAGDEQAENEKEEVVPEAAAEDESSSAAPKRKRRKKKVFQPAELEAMSPRPSLWPLIAAFSVAVLLAGAVSNHIVLGIGFVLVLGSIIGWLRERH